MPKKRLTMRQIRELLRLKYGGSKLSDRAIARQLGVARSTIQDYLARIAAAGLTWPLPDELCDVALDQRLFGRPSTQTGLRRRVEPDWAALARELKRPGVTLQVLWEEYRAVHPGGYGYSRFCDLFRQFELRLSPTMRQHHAAGDKLFVDYSGKKVDIVDAKTGEVTAAEIFVAEWQRELPGLQDRIGKVRQAQGDVGEALASYHASLDIREHLAKADPANASSQRDLSISHDMIGDIQQATGDLKNALASYQASLAIMERLAKADPENAVWQRDLSLSQDKISDIQRAHGDLASALASDQASLAIRERLAKADPDSSSRQRDLSLSLKKIGDVQRAQGNVTAARDSYQASLAIKRRLADADPGNADLQRDLAITYRRVALTADRAEDLSVVGGSSSCCFHIRLLKGKGFRQLAKLLDALKATRQLSLVPVFNPDGEYVPVLWRKRFGDWVGSFAELNDWLCNQNPHVCVHRGQTFHWVMQKPSASVDPHIVASLSCDGKLPRYVLCVPDVKLMTYRETLIRNIDRAAVNLKKLVVQDLRGCDKWDDDCRQLLRNLNATRPRAVDPAVTTYRGEVRLPYAAARLELPPDPSESAQQQAERTWELFTRFVDAGGQREGAEIYAVLTDDRPIDHVLQMQAQSVGSMAEGGDLESQVQQTLHYPYVDTNHRNQRDAFPKVIVGVWDRFVDDHHCAFMVRAQSAVAYPDDLARKQIQDGGKYNDWVVPPGTCATLRSHDRHSDEVDHGTAVAGIIASQPLAGDPGGLNPGARIWAANLKTLLMQPPDDATDPILQFERFLGKDGPLSVANISMTDIDLNYLASQFDSVLFGDSNSSAVQHQRIASDIVVVVASGNDGDYYDQDTPCNLRPACHDRGSAEGTGLITVTASNTDGSDVLRCKDIVAYGAGNVCEGELPDKIVVNYGMKFDVAAPGVAFAPVFGNSFAVEAGTSMATPRVSALASLLIAVASLPPSKSGIGQSPAPSDVRGRILATADQFVAADSTPYAQYGLVNFTRALDFPWYVLEFKNPDVPCELCARTDFRPKQDTSLKYKSGIGPSASGPTHSISWSSILRLHALDTKIYGEAAKYSYQIVWIDAEDKKKIPTLRNEIITVDFDERLILTSASKNSRKPLHVLDLQEFTACSFLPGCPSTVSSSH